MFELALLTRLIIEIENTLKDMDELELPLAVMRLPAHLTEMYEGSQLM